MIALGFVVVLGLPFAAGVGAMALPMMWLSRFALALTPAVLLAIAITENTFWLGEIGGAMIAVMAVFAWVLGTALSPDVRSAVRFAAQLVRR